MDRKRKFEINTDEDEPNNKTFFESEPQVFHGSFSKTASPAQNIKCLICAGEIPLSSESETQILQDQISTLNRLGQLFKVLKLSPEVCRWLVENSSSAVTVLYCESCEEALLSCLNIVQEIHHLQDVWEKMSNQIKENIIKDYHCRRESSGDAFIRKTLVQCWTTCTVRIKPLLPLLPTNKSKHQVDVGNSLVSNLDNSQLTMKPTPVAENKRKNTSRDVITSTTVHNFLGPPVVNSTTGTDVVAAAYSSKADLGPLHDSAHEDDQSRLEKRVALRPRRCQKQTPNYLCDIEKDENLFDSDWGSQYAPDSDSPFEEEGEEKILVRHDDDNDDEQDPLVDVEPELTRQLKKEISQIDEASTTLDSSSRKPRKTSRKSRKISRKPRKISGKPRKPPGRPRKTSQRPVPRATILQLQSRHRLQEFPFHCSICGKGYNLTKCLKVHEDAHGKAGELSSESFPFTCSICGGQRFKSLTSLNSHIAYYHAKKIPIPRSVTDVIEQVVFLEETKAKASSGATEHEKQEEVNVGQLAGECSTGSPRHPKTKNEPEVGTSLRHCKKCSLTFQDAADLKEHEKSSHGHPRNVLCPECPQRFSNIISGRNHQLRIHGKSLETSFDEQGSLQSFLCVYCKEEFVKSSFITLDNSTDPPTHKLSFPELPLPAVASAKNKDELQNIDTVDLFQSFHWNHRLYCKSRPRFAWIADKLDVSNSVKHVCQLCPKEFASGAGLRNHQVIVHTKDFKFCCELCGGPFSTKSRLSNHHRAVHSGKQFKCERCPKTFKTSGELQGHRNTHDNIRPFVCDLCGKAYCTRNVLYMHKWQSHKSVKH